MEYKPYPYGQRAKDHILENPFSGLFLEMGLGKTVITLTALNDILFDYVEAGRVLIIAPLKVAQTVWTDEKDKWDHLKHFRISRILGTEKQRKNALNVKADLYVMNRENVPWLVAYYGPAWPFKIVVIDELSSFKSSKAQRFRALRKVRPLMSRVIGLTGTPAPNNLLDLWPQLYLIDRGERLGGTITGYREAYFSYQREAGYTKYTLIKGNDKIIHDKISDICISMKTRDYLDLPDRLDIDKRIVFSPEVLRLYLEFEKTEVLKLKDLKEITVANAAVLSNKLLQFTAGMIYDDSRKSQYVHDEKLEALYEEIEAANGEPVLVFYQYKHDIERILLKLKHFKPELLEAPAQVKKWNEKKIPVLLCHPQSAGHGLNLQYGGNIIYWYGLPWSCEIYLQAVARLDRQGQIKPVRNVRIITVGTIDEDVLNALNNKIKGQDALMTALKARIDKYLKS